MSWQARLPPAVNDLLNRLGVDPAVCARADGRFTIDVADCGRVDLVPTHAQQVVLDAVIGPLEEEARLRRSQLERVLKFSAARMQGHGETVALSQDGEMLHLQAYIEAALTPVELEDSLGGFFNSMTAWRAMLYGKPGPPKTVLRGMP